MGVTHSSHSLNKKDKKASKKSVVESSGEKPRALAPLPAAMKRIEAPKFVPLNSDSLLYRLPVDVARAVLQRVQPVREVLKMRLVCKNMRWLVSTVHMDLRLHQMMRLQPSQMQLLVWIFPCGTYHLPDITFQEEFLGPFIHSCFANPSNSLVFDAVKSMQRVTALQQALQNDCQYISARRLLEEFAARNPKDSRALHLLIELLETRQKELGITAEEASKLIATMNEKLSDLSKKLQAMALYDFAAQDDEEITLEAGDIVTVLEQDESGWWKGECKGRVGLFPANYVELR